MHSPDTGILLQQFNTTTGQWLVFLDDYDFDRLCWKPRRGSWSLGQVYIHLIVSTEHFLDQARLAAAGEANSAEPMHADAARMFAANAFPAMILEGPDTDDNIPQPAGKAEIALRLGKILQTAKDLFTHFDTQRATGKTRHPGLHYFSAPEWLRFAEMHLRHHFRQKERIDHLYLLDQSTNFPLTGYC